MISQNSSIKIFKTLFEFKNLKQFKNFNKEAINLKVCSYKVKQISFTLENTARA